MSTFATHFYYNGESSDNYNLIICAIDAGGTEEASTGMTLEGIYTDTSSRRNTVGIKYTDEPLSFTTSVIKKSKTYFSRQNVIDVMKWLTKNKFYSWLSFYDGDYVDLDYYCFPNNIIQIKQDGNIIGLKITWECASHWGYTPLQSLKIQVTTSNQPYPIHVDTDENDFIYPYMTIVPANGTQTITLTNNSDVSPLTGKARVCQLTDLRADEVITLDCLNKVAYSNIPLIHRTLNNVFNYKFFRMVPEFNDIIINGNCTITLQYRGARKVGEY